MDEQTAKAFGGCTKCYGKGYSTQLERASGSGDFEYHPIEVEMPYYLPCSCDRGDQIRKMELSLRKKWLEEEIEKLPKYRFPDKDFWGKRRMSPKNKGFNDCLYEIYSRLQAELKILTESL